MTKSLFWATMYLTMTNISAMENQFAQYNHNYMPLNNDEESVTDDEDVISESDEEMDQNVRALEHAQGMNSPENKMFGRNASEPQGMSMFRKGLTHYGSSASSFAEREQNEEKARSYWKRGARQNDAYSQALLAEMWENGKGGDKGKETDLFKAEKLYQLAIKNGAGPDVKLKLANLYLKGGKGKQNPFYPGKPFSQDVKKAMALYREISDQGDLRGTYMLARTYLNNKKYEYAARYFEIVCNSEAAAITIGKVALSQAKSNLATLYWKGRFGSLEDAVRLYKEAIKLGNTEAQKMLSKLMREMPSTTRVRGNGQN